ncbi:hypothetical protein [Clostridium sp. chh4-2]|uniref:hypothetical protein n=1 Tax=Clostridium sp. chh4-2 TaxID=2067550 RepID=UPI0015E176C0|nr:hypothetical protein [Clostridium sp. chh4-2]
MNNGKTSLLCGGGVFFCGVASKWGIGRGRGREEKRRKEGEPKAGGGRNSRNGDSGFAPKMY